mgnify:CR=1 FL=1
MSEKEILEAKKNSEDIKIDDITVLNKNIPVLGEEKEEKKEEVKEEVKKEEPKEETPKVEVPTVAAPVEEKTEEKPVLSGFSVPNAPTDILKPPVAPSFVQPSVPTPGTSSFAKQTSPMTNSLYNGSLASTSTSEFKSHTEIDEYYDNKNKDADRFCEETKRTNDIERQKAHGALNKTDAFEEWRKNLFNIPGVDDAQTIQNAPAGNGIMFGQTNDANDVHRIM